MFNTEALGEGEETFNNPVALKLKVCYFQPIIYYNLHYLLNNCQYPVHHAHENIFKALKQLCAGSLKTAKLFVDS